MTVNRRQFLILSGTAALGVTAAPSASAAPLGPARLRGMTAPATVPDVDIDAFAATGGNMLRVAFAGMPLMAKSPPYGLNQAAFDRLDHVLERCESRDIRVIIDPHTFPGLSDDYTTFPTDPFWSDYAFHDLIEQFWDYTSNRYKGRGPVIAGYDLLNEPAVTDVRADSGPGSWNELVLRLASAIRSNDTQHTIVIEPAISAKPTGPLWYSYFEAINELPPPPDQNVLISPHMYVPHAFTQQGIPGNGYPLGPQYPGAITGQGWEGLPATVQWDRHAMEEYMRPALAYSRTYRVPIYVGEFSVVRWAGDSGNRYLADCVAFFEEHSWSWSYHSWREYEGWDAELNNYDPNDLTATPPRHDWNCSPPTSDAIGRRSGEIGPAGAVGPARLSSARACRTGRRARVSREGVLPGQHFGEHGPGHG